jgi:hypothetical protein
VVDWRAPVAEPFYRATGSTRRGWPAAATWPCAAAPCSGWKTSTSSTPIGRAPGAPAPPGPDGRHSVRRDPSGSACSPRAWCWAAPGALLSALGQARTGHMGDIIGTIQREQDEIIRSPLSGVLVVQGGPGTGKTAVALHRAAYLLYTHRFPLERQGVLVVGPNPLFLRYIEQVLPSLGETGVSLSTVAGLVPEVRVRGVDDPAVAKLKGDVRMVKVLARAVRTRQRPLRHDVEVPFGAGVLRLRAQTTEEIVALARGARDPQRAPPLRRGARAARAGRRLPGPADPGVETTGRGRTSTPSAEEQADLAQRLRRTPRWPSAGPDVAPPVPHELLHDLLGARPLLAAAGQGILSPDDVQRLYRPRSPALDEVPWTVADAALIDEARTMLGPRRGGRVRTGPVRPGRGGERPGGRVLAPGPGRLPVPTSGASIGPRTRSAPSATSWSTRCRTSRPCSCACWPAGRCRDR